jgi:hypothetical protein
MEFQDWGVASNVTTGVEYAPIPDEKKMEFALWVLLGVFLLFVLSATASVFSPQSGDKIFETSKTVLPPIVTLVLGYFFSRNN